MSTLSRPRAALKVKRKNVPGVLFRAQTMHDAIVANAAMFVSPPITMVAFLALITALAVAQQQVLGTRARGSATLRNTRRDALWTAMDSLQSFVQGLADTFSAEGAASVIEAAGLLVALTGTYQKPLLTATLTSTPGVVHLDANASLLVGKASASKKTTFNWQWSGDGGASWHGAQATPYANTDIQGLAPMATYAFRVSVTIGKTAGAWSQAVTLLVV